MFRNPDLAHSYRSLAEGGRAAFYRGDLAQVMSDFMARHGGFLRLAKAGTNGMVSIRLVPVCDRGASAKHDCQASTDADAGTEVVSADSNRDADPYSDQCSNKGSHGLIPLSGAIRFFKRILAVRFDWGDVRAEFRVSRRWYFDTSEETCE